MKEDLDCTDGFLRKKSLQSVARTIPWESLGSVGHPAGPDDASWHADKPGSPQIRSRLFRAPGSWNPPLA